MDTDSMAALLSDLLNQDKAIRSNAEMKYNHLLKQNPSSVVTTLVSCINIPSAIQANSPVQTIILVLLRQIVRNNWNEIQPNVVEFVLKKELLRLFDVSSSTTDANGNQIGNVNTQYLESFQRKLATIFISFPLDHLGTFSQTLLPHLLSNLESQMQLMSAISKGSVDLTNNNGNIVSQVESKIISILFFIEKLAEISFASVFSPRIQVLQKITNCYTQLIRHQTYASLPKTRLATCRSTVSIIVNSPEPRDFSDIGKSLPKCMIDSIVQLSNHVNGHSMDEFVSTSKNTLESLSHLSDVCFWAFESEYGPICVTLLSISSSATANSQIRCLATQILADLFAKRGKLVVQDEGFLRQVLQVLIKMCCEDEEFEHEWIDQQKTFAQDPSILTYEDILLRSWSGLRSFALEALESLINAAASTIPTAQQSNKNNKAAANATNGGIGMNFLTIYFEYVKILLASTSSVEKHAGFSCISLILGPYSKKIWVHIKDIVNGSCFMLSPASMSDIRVQYAAAACLHELFANEALSKVIARTMHGSIMPVLIAQLSTSTANNAVVTSAVCLTLSQYCRSITSDFAVDSLLPYLDNLIQGITQLISNASLFAVQVSAMDALESIAKLVKSNFGRYYDNLMPGLKIVLSNSAASSPLRRSSMMCIATIAESISKEKFAADAPQILQFLLMGLDVNASNQSTASSSNTSSKGLSMNDKADELEALFEFSKRACSILKDDFVSFLPHIVPILVAACSTDIGVEIQPTNEMPEDLDNDANGNSDDPSERYVIQHINGVGNFKVKANVYAIQLRMSAIECIDGFADTLGGSFFPYVEPCAAVMLPAISEKSLTSIKVKAAEASASLLHSACLYLTDCGGKSNQDLVNGVQKFFVTLVTTLTTSLYESSSLVSSSIADPVADSTQDGDDRRLGFVTAIERCARISFYSGTPALIAIPQNMIQPFIVTLLDCYKQSITRRSDEMARLQKMGYDADDIERFAAEVEEIEAELCKEIVDAVGWVLKTNKDNFLPVFDEIVGPLFSKLLHPTIASSIRHNALCLYSDVVQYCGPVAAEKYGTYSLENMMKYCVDADPLIRLVCVYAIGIIAEHAPIAFSKKMSEALQLLHKVGNTRTDVARHQQSLANGADADNEDGNDDEQVSQEAAECAMSTIGKICRLYGGQKQMLPAQLEQQYLTYWSQSLPLHYDEEESKFSHKLFIQLVCERNPIIVQDQLTNGGRNTVRVLSEIVEMANRNSMIGDDAKELIEQDDLSKIPMILSGLASTA